MNIAIISPGPFSVPPVNGSSVEHDIDQVSRVLAREHTVYIYTRTCLAYPKSEGKGNLQYIRVRYRGGNDYLRRVTRELRKRPVDVVLVENRPAYVPTLRRHLPTTPLLVNMHSHLFASPGVIRPEKMREAIGKMDGMITNSEYLRAYFIERHGVPADKVRSVHLGVDVEPYQEKGMAKAAKEKRRKLGLQPDERVLLYAGRLMPQKGVHLLIRSFRQVAGRDPKARLVLVGGTGYGRNRTNAYVKRLRRLAKPLGSKVRFVNFVSPDEMPLWYQIGDIVATPSLWNEPFCRVNLEGMASGKPVISTNRGGIPEVIGNAGFMLPPAEWPKRLADIWDLLWKVPALRSELGKQALRRAREFSWEATADGYLAAFAEAIASRSQTPQTAATPRDTMPETAQPRKRRTR